MFCVVEALRGQNYHIVLIICIINLYNCNILALLLKPVGATCYYLSFSSCVKPSYICRWSLQADIMSLVKLNMSRWGQWVCIACHFILNYWTEHEFFFFCNKYYVKKWIKLRQQKLLPITNLKNCTQGRKIKISKCLEMWYFLVCHTVPPLSTILWILLACENRIFITVRCFYEPPEMSFSLSISATEIQEVLLLLLQNALF